jgi:ankyrin repeat protein
MQLLLEYWEDPNIPNDVSGTALYQCAAKGVTGNVALLLEHGADPNIMNAERSRNLRFNWRINYIGPKYHNYGSPLNIACYNGNLDTVIVLLEGGAEVNSPADGPFHTPAQYLVEGARAAAKGGYATTEYKHIKKIWNQLVPT